MIGYKFLRPGRRSLFARVQWPLPSEAGGAWLEAAPGPLVACKNGLHACRIEDLAFWIGEELWEVELDAELAAAPDAIVARRARLLRPIEAWSAQAPRAFGQSCIARARAQLGPAGLAPDHIAARYLEQAEQLDGTGYIAALSYAAALACALIVPPSAAVAAFRSERAAQGPLLAEAAGLPNR